MKKIFLSTILLFFMMSVGVFAYTNGQRNCTGTSADIGGCDWRGTVSQSEDIYFNSTGWINTHYGSVWDCNGYKLVGTGKTAGVTLFQYGASVSNLRVEDCVIEDFSVGWSVLATAGSGNAQNNYFNRTTFNDVGTAMYMTASAHVDYSFQATNDGIDNSVLNNVDYGLVTSCSYSQDGCGYGVFTNNEMYNGVIGVRIGHSNNTADNGGYNEGTLGNWIIDNNEFHNVMAGVWLMQGMGGTRTAYITDNIFDSSDLRLQRSHVEISGNTFTNNSRGHNGCIEPVTWENTIGSYSTDLLINTNYMPMCNGNWSMTGRIYVGSNGKLYPQTAHQSTLIQSYSANTVGVSSVLGTGNNYGRDYITIQDMNLVNFSTGIFAQADCYNHAFDPVSDTMSNWNILGNNIYDYDDMPLEDNIGIYIGYDDTRYCSVYNMTVRDNYLFNLTTGISLNGVLSDYVYGHITMTGIELSFNDFISNDEGISETYVWGDYTGNNKIIVFNNFVATNNTVTHTGFDWFGNYGSQGSRIQDQNTCQYPDMVRFVDGDVTFCDGTYVVPAGWRLIPFNNVKIYCDGTEMVDDTLHSSAGVMLSGYYYLGTTGDYKTAGLSNAVIEGCTFTNFSSGLQFYGSSGSTYNGGVTNLEVKYNTFNNLDWGIYLYAGSNYIYTSATNWNIHHNTFQDITNEGVFVQGEVSSAPNNGMNVYNWQIDNNYFNRNKYGIRLIGDEYSVSTCYNLMYNFSIDYNEFHSNENHIRFEHPDLVQCPTQSPRDVSAHYNIFARDFSAFSVLNYHAVNYDFTYNNWGTGFTGIIDQAIFDDYDASQYGLISYIPIIGYTLQYGTPLAIQENWEEALATDSEAVINLPITYQSTGYDSNIAFNGNEKWLLARSNAQARGNVYLTDEDLCINFNCYKAQVDSLDVNPHYARVTRFFPQTINLTSETEIRFKTYYDSDYWDSGGAMIFRNANDQVLLKIDLGITNETNYATAMGTTKLCSIASVTGTNLTGKVAQQDQWHSYTFTLQDVVDNCYSSWGNIFTTAKQIDRIEFVFGGKRNGAIGDVIWYLDDIAVENVDFNTPPSNTPPSGATVKFQETFGQGYNFDVTATDCLVSPEGYDHTQFSGHTPKYVGGDNDWICWLNSSTGSPTIHYEDSSDTLHVSSDLGMMHTVSGSVNPTISSWASSGNYGLDMSGGNADYFLFTCDMSNQTHGNSYLLVGSNTATYIDETKSAYISLKNGGCVYNDTLPYQYDQYDSNKVPCCELFDIAGNDCSGGKTKIEFSEQDVEDACFDEGVGDLSFIDIDRVEFVTLKRTTGADQVFFDDFYMYSLGVIGNNTMPNIYTMDCVPDPTNVSQPVSCGVGVFDPDNNNSEIYTAFDCDTSTPSLDYNWALRGVLPTFSCTFNSENTFTQQTWATDTYHYPTYNSTATATTSAILEVAPPRPTTGGSCSGYIPQTCSGTCYFTDNFNYDKMISCAGWNGQIADFHPTSNVLGIYGTDVYEYDLEMDKGSSNAIESSSVKSFETKFDIRVKSDDLLNYQIYNKEMNKNVMVSVIDNYVLKAYKDTGSLTLMELNPNQWYNIKVVTDFNTYQNYWYVDSNLVGTIDLYENGITSARHWDFGWSHTTEEFDLDNFRVNILSYQTTNQTGGNETGGGVEYTYNGEMFCAINWTKPEGATDRFSEENCAERGFPTNYPLLSLCIPRACLQDVGLMTLDWATSNIFRTIIIVTAFILIAPLLVALMKRRM